MIPHKMYIPHIPSFVYSVCFYSQSILQKDLFHGIIFGSVLCSASFNFSVYTDLNYELCFGSSR